MINSETLLNTLQGSDQLTPVTLAGLILNSKPTAVEDTGLTSLIRHEDGTISTVGPNLTVVDFGKLVDLQLLKGLANGIIVEFSVKCILRFLHLVDEVMPVEFAFHSLFPDICCLVVQMEETAFGTLIKRIPKEVGKLAANAITIIGIHLEFL